MMPALCVSTESGTGNSSTRTARAGAGPCRSWSDSSTEQAGVSYDESPGSGGTSCVVACHILAAVRIATSRATPAPTPVAMAQLRASVHVADLSAGIGGGLLPCTPFHTFSSTRCVMRADTAPDPSVITFQLYALTVTMITPIPGLVPA